MNLVEALALVGLLGMIAIVGLKVYNITSGFKLYELGGVFTLFVLSLLFYAMSMTAALADFSLYYATVPVLNFSRLLLFVVFVLFVIELVAYAGSTPTRHLRGLRARGGR